MEILYYNEDWLNELGYSNPPENWDQFREMVTLAKTQPFSRAANPKNAVGYELDVNASRFASMVFSRSGRLMDPDCSRYMLNTPETRQTLLFLRDLIQNDLAEIVVERYGDKADFGAGILLFSISSTSGIPFIEEAVEAGVKFNWSVAPLPHSTAEPIQNIYGASISVLNSTPEKELASWLFLKWFTDTPQQVRWAKSSNYFPVRKSAAKDLEEYFTANPTYKKCFDLLAYGISEPSVPGYDLVRDRIEKSMMDVIKGADIEKVLGILETEAQKTLTPGK
jgi:multiple sugar transport system substrate-binding protein/sn-glycerol 3-phosphate transport system substrate-binding protein